MVSFVVYDLIFLVVFTLLVVLFLYTRKHNLKRQGLMYLYRTSVGLKIMDTFANKYRKILKPAQYVVIACGYVLMAAMVYLLVQFTYLYSKFDIVSQVKIPPVLPLFPYATDLFKVGFLPPFYFTYWIIIIAIIAVSHEFAHGIFARLNNIKIKSTGFGFLGPFLAAFVEPDEEHMEKAGKFKQLAVLGAGTFANVIMTIIFGVIMVAFFSATFSPVGINFNAYPQEIISVDSINSVNGVAISDFSAIASLGLVNLTKIESNGSSYLVPAENLQKAAKENIERVTVYDDAPAVKAGLKGSIIKIDGQQITSLDKLKEVLDNYQPGDFIEIQTINKGKVEVYDLQLGNRDGEAYLGVGFIEPRQNRVTGVFTRWYNEVKDPHIYYESRIGNLGTFIYDLLWWIVLINISVALMNMLPVGIFDGGRFFYLTVLAITRSERVAKWSFKFTTYAALAILIWLMVRWAVLAF